MQHVILVIDDDEAILRTHARILKKHGFEVLCAPSLEAARTILDQGSTIHLVLTDLELKIPGAPKCEYSTTLYLAYKEALEARGTRVIAMTGGAPDDVLQVYRDAGVVIVGKPVHDYPALVALIRSHLPAPLP